VQLLREMLFTPLHVLHTPMTSPVTVRGYGSLKYSPYLNNMLKESCRPIFCLVYVQVFFLRMSCLSKQKHDFHLSFINNRIDTNRCKYVIPDSTWCLFTHHFLHALSKCLSNYMFRMHALIFRFDVSDVSEEYIPRCCTTEFMIPEFIRTPQCWRIETFKKSLTWTI
jgi:hypothetical protein